MGSKVNIDERTCPDCHATVLSGAVECPACGCPLDAFSRPGPVAVRFLLAVTLLIFVAIGFGLYWKYVSLADAPLPSPDNTASPGGLTPAVSGADVGPPRGETSEGTYRHSASVCQRAAFSPAGHIIASAFRGQDVLLWARDRGIEQEPLRLVGHTGPVHCVTFSPSGVVLASAGQDQEVRLWEVHQGRELKRLRGHTAPINSVVFAPPGRMLASAGEDRTVRVWDLSSDTESRVLSGHTSAVQVLAFDRRGRFIASASANGTIKIWDVETGDQRQAFQSEHGSALSLVFSPDSRTLAAVNDDDTVTLWDLESGAARASLSGEGHRCFALAFSSSSNILMTSGLEGNIKAWSSESGEELKTYPGSPHAILSLFFEPGGNKIATRSIPLQLLDHMGATDLAGRVATATRVGEKEALGFQVADGLDVKLFAAEPLVANPAAICVDEKQRVWVAETFRWDRLIRLAHRGREFWLLDDLACQTVEDRLKMYQKWQHKVPGGMAWHTKHSERVRRLEDSDGDGRADQVTVFSEGYNRPEEGTGAGLMARDGKIYYACMPRLWVLEDQDDDGRADNRTVLHDGFGVCNSLAHDLHGLTWGFDGKLYFSVGDHGYHVTTQEGETLHDPGVGAVFRCNSDGSELEVYARGLRNPHELAFDQHGNLFTVDNNADVGDSPRLVYVVPGGNSGWQMSFETIAGSYNPGPWHMDKLWYLRDKDQAAWIVPPIAHLAIGPAGLAYYPGLGLPERYQNHFFLCDFAVTPQGSGIRTFSLAPQGAGFELLQQSNFVTNMVPTDVEFGYDGKMYVSDWVGGWRASGGGRIYTFFDSKRQDSDLRRQTASLFREGFSQRSSEELVGLLQHEDLRVRQRAQFALADRGSVALDDLAQVALHENHRLARLHAIWGLGMLGDSDRAAPETLVSLLDDDDDEVRAQVAKVLGETRYTEAAQLLLERLRDVSPRVRFFAANALGQCQYKPAILPLVEMLRENNDRDAFLRHAGVMALAMIDDADGLLVHADSDRSVRLAVLLAWRRLRDPRVARFLHDPDDAIVTEAARAIHDIPLNSSMPQLATLLERGGQNEPLLRRVINANFRLGGVEQARSLIHFATQPGNSLGMRVEAIGALVDWEHPSSLDRVLGSHRPLPDRSISELKTMLAPEVSTILEDSNSTLQHEAIRLARAWKIQTIDTDFAAWIADSTRASATRMEALGLMAEFEDPQLPEAIRLALSDQDPRLRAAGARILATHDPAHAIRVLRDALEGDSVVERQAALLTLASINDSQAQELLSAWLEKLEAGMVPAELQLDVVEALREVRSPVLRTRLSQFEEHHSGLHQESVNPMLLYGGNSQRGAVLYSQHTSLQCVRCHRMDGVGGVIGPDVTKIGARLSRQELLESLQLPNKTIAKGYETVVIETTDGKVILGIVQSEDDQQLKIITPQGKVISLPADTIEQRTVGQSAMPGDLVKDLSPIELRDLVEFLATRK